MLSLAFWQALHSSNWSIHLISNWISITNKQSRLWGYKANKLVNKATKRKTNISLQSILLQILRPRTTRNSKTQDIHKSCRYAGKGRGNLTYTGFLRWGLGELDGDVRVMWSKEFRERVQIGTGGKTPGKLKTVAKVSYLEAFLVVWAQNASLKA